MLVSIVMPSFNQAHFIELSIRSVFAQHYQPLELIIVDGGSTDQTISILKRLQKEFGTALKWVSQADNGPADAINKALKKAQGQIIGWLNSDDLYAKKAIKNAITAFKQQPQWVLLYGEANHIDEQGQFINQYPTKPPPANRLDFQMGCYICQPTVFFRREILTKVGFLDARLLVAFDFDFWIRIFKQYPQGIGYINKIQAYSRLHEACITKTQRQAVIIEAMKVISMHFGKAKIHWLQSYFEEIYQTHPFNQQINHLQNHFIKTIQLACPYLTYSSLDRLFKQLNKDIRWRITPPNLSFNSYPDGWVKPVLIIKIQHPKNTKKLLVLHCQHCSPNKGDLKLDISTPWMQDKQIKKHGRFYIFIPIPAFKTQQNIMIEIKSNPYFIPHQTTKNPDKRQLAFKLHQISQL